MLGACARVESARESSDEPGRRRARAGAAWRGTSGGGMPARAFRGGAPHGAVAPHVAQVGQPGEQQHCASTHRPLAEAPLG